MPSLSDEVPERTTMLFHERPADFSIGRVSQGTDLFRLKKYSILSTIPYMGIEIFGERNLYPQKYSLKISIPPK